MAAVTRAGWGAVVAVCVGAITGASERGQQARSPERPSLEARLSSIRESGSLPAVAGAVFTADGILAQAAVGVRKLGADTPVSGADLWHIGSITKSFTATLVATFVERGDLKWTQTLGDLVGAERARQYAAVTLEHLLTHRAGLPANVSPAITSDLAQSSSPVAAQRQRAADAVFAVAPLAPPGERYLYSNAGYIVAGAILEARTGQPWEELVRAQVLAPLKLASSGFGPPGPFDALTQPRGHRRQADGRLLPVEPGVFGDNPAFLGPAGRLHMTIADLALWGRAHLRGARGRDGLVRAATFQRLHKPPVAGSDYAYGWAIRVIAGRQAIWHNGSNTLWYAAVAFDAEADLGAALATNGSIAAQAGIESGLAQLFADWRSRRP